MTERAAQLEIKFVHCIAFDGKTPYNRINKENKLLPHKFDGVYDDRLPVISLVKYGQTADNIKYVMNNAFGFGGSKAVMILGKAE